MTDFSNKRIAMKVWDDNLPGYQRLWEEEAYTLQRLIDAGDGGYTPILKGDYRFFDGLQRLRLGHGWTIREDVIRNQDGGYEKRFTLTSPVSIHEVYPE